MISIPALAAQWSEVKMAIQHGLSFSSDSLHAQVGMLLLLLFHRLLHRRHALWVSWLLLLGAELANEALDMSRPPGSLESDLGSSLHDVINTMLVPTAMLLFWPSARGQAGRAEDQPR